MLNSVNLNKPAFGALLVETKNNTTEELAKLKQRHDGDKNGYAHDMVKNEDGVGVRYLYEVPIKGFYGDKEIKAVLEEENEEAKKCEEGGLKVTRNIFGLLEPRHNWEGDMGIAAAKPVLSPYEY